MCYLYSAWMKKKGASAEDPASCPACETAVIWIQNQLKQKGNKKKNMLNHVNEVTHIETIPFILC